MAAKKQPTNNDLHILVTDGFKNVHKRLDEVEDEVKNVTGWMNFEKGRQDGMSQSAKAKQGSELNITPDFLKIVIAAVGVVLAAITGGTFFK